METSGFLFDLSLCRGNMVFLGYGGNPPFRGAASIITMEESSKKRPFFGYADEFFDEEYYDEQASEKKHRLTSEQVHLLEKSFETENNLEPERKTQLSNKLGLQPKQVAIWFQNRRVRWKTKQLERDYDLLKSSYDLLLNKYDSVAKQNEPLKSEIIFLSEKLQPKEVEDLPISGLKNDLFQTEDDHHASLKNNTRKVEDQLSSGSCRSAVVDEDSPQLLNSEEEDGSNDCLNYLSDVMAVADEQQRHEEEETLNWWIWPLEE